MNNKKNMMICMTTLIAITFCFSESIAQPTVRSGWPQQFDDTFAFVRSHQCSWIEDSSGEIFIAASSSILTALYDLNGNILPGWPSPAIEPWYVTDGPFLGDVTGNGNIDVSVLYKTAWADTLLVQVYNLNGELNDQFTHQIDLGLEGGGQMVLYDLDDDGSPNLIYIADSIYAYTSDHTPLPGFPKPTLGTQLGVNQMVIIPETLAGEKLVAWITYDGVYVSPVNSSELSPGWPRNMYEPGSSTAPLVVPYEDSWAMSYYIRDSLHVRNSDGEYLDGFPKFIFDRFEQVQSLSATDINLDGIPEIVVRKAYGNVFVVDLEGNTLFGFPYSNNYAYAGVGEDVLSIHIQGDEFAKLFYAMIERFENAIFYHGMMGLHGRFPMEGYPAYEEGTDGNHYLSSALIWTEGCDTLHMVRLKGFGELTVFDLPLPAGSSVKLLWPMQGGNSGGNRVYEPGPYLEVDDNSDNFLPDYFELSKAYPNPFNSSVNIPFSLPEPSNVKITIYDILGREVAILVDQNKSAGKHSIHWNGKNLNDFTSPSGIYFLRMEVGSFTQTQKIILLK
jgi:Secretion system C-terminal sorting domain